jgi:hypothetical protein
MSIRSRSEKGYASRNWRTNFRIGARLPVWLENSTFFFFIKPAAVERIARTIQLRNRKGGGQPAQA